ncbi:hypothetical protein SAMN05421856_11168 [Chryseobacterium taichungense]|uniref:LysM domain-containing protein n=2 Tax=Chryseobacterium taichungense TaxID=295069 RepID=A0A1H8D1J3_9FLAO|nr:hypothetical protein SAMN05421856_11168 [Chryseobacterium taichungense]
MVKKGETLENIISLYNIPTIEMLRFFHNQNAPKDSNHIGFSIFSGQKLFIPGKKEIDSIISERKIKAKEFLDIEQNKHLNQNLKFPFVNGNHKYKVSLQEDGSDEIIFFTLQTEFVKKEEELYYLNIRQSEINENENTDKSCVELLASEINKNIYPLKAGIDEKGCIRKIDEVFLVRKKWNNKKADLHEFFPREFGKKMLDDVEENLHAPERLVSTLNLSIVWTFLFRAITGKYENGKCEKEINLIDQYSKFPVLNIMEKKIIGDGKTFQIRQEIFERNSDEMKAKGFYILNTKSNILLNAEINLFNMPEHLILKITKTQ